MGLTGIRTQRLPPRQVPFVELVSLCALKNQRERVPRDRERGVADLKTQFAK